MPGVVARCRTAAAGIGASAGAAVSVGGISPLLVRADAGGARHLAPARDLGGDLGPPQPAVRRGAGDGVAGRGGRGPHLAVQPFGDRLGQASRSPTRRPTVSAALPGGKDTTRRSGRAGQPAASAAARARYGVEAATARGVSISARRRMAASSSRVAAFRRDHTLAAAGLQEARTTACRARGAVVGVGLCVEEAWPL